MKYETIIGLEVHIQLATEKKAFCGCGTRFGAEPNTETCPICLGEPGTSPQLNKTALEYALKAALALNCQVPAVATFDRKHYTAPDLPKGYQITQYRHPIGRQGFLDIDVAGQVHQIPIKQVHLEEDAGRTLETARGELIDFNRAGIPLLEVVTPPVFRSGQVARAYLEALQLLMRYLEVSDARIEEGSMRCELNISLRPLGSSEMGELCEIKNIGSFSGVIAAIAFEEQRQAALLNKGQPVVRETRRWDERSQATYPMRRKEQVSDYRYVPEPNLAPVAIDPAGLGALRQALPELPLSKQIRYQHQLGLSRYQAQELASDPALASYFEDVLPHYGVASDVANWLLTELRALLNKTSHTFANCPMAPQDLAELLQLVQEGTLSHNIAKELLAEGFASGQKPAALARSRGMRQVSDLEQLTAWAEQAISANAAVVREYQGGKERAFGYLVGQVMRLSGGLANPRLVHQVLKQALAKK